MALSSCPSSSRSLLYEGEVYRKLAGCPGIANVTWFGMHGSDYSLLVMDLLGPTLYSIWMQLGQRLSMRSLLMIVDQTLETISQLHSRGFVHRDISPSNFMLGPSKVRRCAGVPVRGYLWVTAGLWPRSGSGVVRIDPLRFLTERRKR